MSLRLSSTISIMTEEGELEKLRCSKSREAAHHGRFVGKLGLQLKESRKHIQEAAPLGFRTRPPNTDDQKGRGLDSRPSDQSSSPCQARIGFRV